MRTIDTNEYVTVLRELTEQGKEVSVLISGNSMAPFLCHQRDMICFEKPKGLLRKGDMVFYQRENGQFLMHRIYRVTRQGYYLVGDAQRVIEGPLKEEQIFAVITKVKRKGHWIGPGNFVWEFFEHIWIRMVPARHLFMALYRRLCRRK